jgi:DNA-directed RNA polymerase specialized sigma24 family protein
VHPAIAKLTPAEVCKLLASTYDLSVYCHENGIGSVGKALGWLLDLHEQLPAPPPTVDTPRRRDATRLRAYLDQYTGLSRRMEQTAVLCLVNGLSLSECAKQMGVSRETVRTQLRRLRARERRVRQIQGYFGDSYF